MTAIAFCNLLILLTLFITKNGRNPNLKLLKSCHMLGKIHYKTKITPDVKVIFVLDNEEGVAQYRKKHCAAKTELQERIPHS